MSLDWYGDVRTFMSAVEQPVGDSPRLPPMAYKMFRMRLIYEEVVEETLVAIQNDDIVKIADGIADSCYVLLGTAVSYGIDMRPVWELVQAANMRKVGAPQRPDGKIMKPKGWEPPDIEGEIRRQGSL